MTLDIRQDVPLALLTTFKIGGKAKYFVDVKSISEIREAISWSKTRDIELVVLGGGSNVLVSDSGIDALVVHILLEGYDFGGGDNGVCAGVNLLSTIRGASDATLGGWEKLAGIPGSVGGAIRGNAGAFGSEIKDFVTLVRAVNANTEEIKEFTNAECNFAYRHSYFKDHPEWIITDAEFMNLRGVDREESLNLIERTIAEREKRHLQNVQAAGSFFMNPTAPRHVQEMFEQEKNTSAREGRVPAGWLIEKAGMKGAKVGDAMASLQHPNYIVNTGRATSEDVRKLATDIKVAVHQQFGVTLTEEAAIF